MRILSLSVFLCLPLAADWGAVQRIAPDHAIEIVTQAGDRSRSNFVSASPESIVIRDSSGERSLERAAVREIKALDPSRRTKLGLISTAIGAAAGAALGVAVCPSCPGEGKGHKTVYIGLAAGAGVGALGFLSSPYRAVYKSK